MFAILIVKIVNDCIKVKYIYIFLDKKIYVQMNQIVNDCMKNKKQCQKDMIKK